MSPQDADFSNKRIQKRKEKKKKNQQNQVLQYNIRINSPIRLEGEAGTGGKVGAQSTLQKKRSNPGLTSSQ